MSEASGKKNIIITGATSGIGRALAARLDDDAHHLVLIGRSQDKLDALAGQLRASTTLIALDLAEVEQIPAIAPQLPGRIDGFVHAAGVESVEPIKLVSYAKFDAIMRLHVYAFVELLKLIEKSKKRSDDYLTSVVALSSIASDNGGVGQTMYAASKAALEAAVRVLTKELAAKRIRINAVKPGIVDTDMTRRWMRKIGVADIADVQAMQLNGIAEPSEIAELIAFLLSNGARHIAGTQIKIDGGGPAGKVF
ncbi:SDR family NAD(P)-dependent oxidoreductase [Massilia sp. 9I]|uniref:SDR family NAD(P)-dependent oxidoreductase n=1 Tax=Massilia sp. 9I TaxID=2653152 RepID=UPI0012F067AC|nr:SDR family oxidoreductase [Massilia sp. 9I]VXC75786.1 Dehydrogenases with different specificities (related to short-chain alcohol dehydrogenases) [Massilia sp. 9I]